jgi:ABC-type multidrug transport system permease subunit
MKIFEIVKKDFKILIRSKLSALIILLGPLLIVSLVGLAFNNSSVNNIKIGTYSSNYSNLSIDLINSLKDKQFSIIKYSSEDSCIESIKTGNSHVCMSIPKDLDINNNSSEITFYVDNSRINLVYYVISEVSGKITIQSKELTKGLTQNIIDVLSDAQIKLVDDNSKISEIKASNSEISSNVDNIINNVGSFSVDINVSALKVNQIKSGQLTCGSNCSADYLDAVEAMASKLSSLQTDIDNINSAQSEIQNSAETIKSDSSKNSGLIDSIGSNVNSTILNINALPIKESEKIANPIKTSIKPITESKTNLSFLFPTLIALVIMLVSILLSSTIVIREKKTRAYFRNFITPTSNFTFMIGTFITCLLILIIQLIVIFSQIFITLGSQLILTISPFLVIILFLIATVFILFGMFIGYAFQTEETVTLATFSISTLFLFLSNTLLPIESIPEQIRWLALFNPFVVADSILKKMILFNAQIITVLNELYLLLAYVALLMSLVYIARLINKRKLV